MIAAGSPGWSGVASAAFEIPRTRRLVDHPRHPHEQQRFAPDAVDELDRTDRFISDVDHADDQIRVDRARLREPDVRQRGRGVVDDRVDSDQLLEDRQPARRRSARDGPTWREATAPRPPSRGVCSSPRPPGSHRSASCGRSSPGSSSSTSRATLLLARVDQVARRLGHPSAMPASRTSDGYRRQPQHQAPVAGRGEDRVDDEGGAGSRPRSSTGSTT